MCKMLGYEAPELLSLSVESIHRHYFLKEVLERFGEAAPGRRQQVDNVPILRKYGEIFFVEVGIGLLNYQGRSCLIGLYHDITDRKKAEEARREKEEYI